MLDAARIVWVSRKGLGSVSSGSSDILPEQPEHSAPQASWEAEQRVAGAPRHVRELATMLARAEQRERRRLSEILRDELQQLLYGVQLRLRMARDVLGADPHDEAGRQLVHADAMLQQCARVTRQLRLDLNPPIREQAGLKSILAWLQGPMKEIHGLDIELVGDEVRVDDGDVRALLIQLLRELLFGAATHSGARRARVSLRDAEDELRLEIVDDGRGIEATAVEVTARGRSLTALAGIRESVGVLGGRLEIESEPGTGTRIHVRFPRTAMFAA